MPPFLSTSAFRRLVNVALGVAMAVSPLQAIKPSNSDILELERFLAPQTPDLKDLKDLGNPPVPKVQVRPEFPAHLRSAPLSAEILVGFIVDSSGAVPHAYAIRSSNPWFDRGAIEAVRQWRFDPGRVNGRAVNTRMQVPIQFNLQFDDAAAWSLRVLADPSKLPAHLRYDSPPSVLESTFAPYPFKALLEDRGAKVNVRAFVDVEGRVVGTAFPATPDPEFAGAVAAMMNHWRFKPATLEGKPVASVVFIDFTFSPKKESCAPVSPSAKAILKELARKEPRIFTLADLDAPPLVVAHHLPLHPPALRAAGVGGRALIEMFIDEAGNVQLPRVVEATHPDFGYAAAQAVATWWFEPPLRNGKPVTVRTRVPVVFAVTEPESNGTEEDGPGLHHRDPSGE